MKKALIAVVLGAVLLCGCGKEEKPAATPITAEAISEEAESSEESTKVEESEEAAEESEVEETQEAVISERTVVDGKMQSYLTGEWKDEAVVKRRSMAVMMPNNKKAMPQYGLSQASLIYEAPVEGGISRLMAFYEDYDELDHIGPVRSSRDYYIYEAMAYDAVYCNWGLARPYVEELINSDRIDNVSNAVAGIYNPASEAFSRIDRPGYATEYTGYLFIDGYEKAVERLGYSKEYRDTFVKAFDFAADGHPATYEDKESAVKIYPGGDTTNGSGYGDAKPYFEYNAEDGLYYRYQFGGKHIDEMNGEQLAVTNVVFKICHGELRDQKYGYLAFGVHGEGDAYIFTAGKVIKGTWKRESDTAPNLFFDEDGNEIILNQGKTWMCNIWKEYQDCMKYE